jgi:hypothetical protein
MSSAPESLKKKDFSEECQVNILLNSLEEFSDEF